MTVDQFTKDRLKRELVSCLAQDAEISRIVVFGSFLTSDSPNDMDVAIFQNSQESYLTLAMKYRKQSRPVSHSIPLDIIPICGSVSTSQLLHEIEMGEVIYER
jgi:predicted nucleotidyltransferase